jgi:hypothetical protein
MKQINCFIAFKDAQQAQKTVENISQSGLVNKIYLLTSQNSNESLPGCEIILVDSITSTATINKN